MEKILKKKHFNFTLTPYEKWQYIVMHLIIQMGQPLAYTFKMFVPSSKGLKRKIQAMQKEWQ